MCLIHHEIHWIQGGAKQEFIWFSESSAIFSCAKDGRLGSTRFPPSDLTSGSRVSGCVASCSTDVTSLVTQRHFVLRRDATRDASKMNTVFFVVVNKVKKSHMRCLRTLPSAMDLERFSE